MVDPAVFEAVNGKRGDEAYDPELVTGFAFGFGLGPAGDDFDGPARCADARRKRRAGAGAVPVAVNCDPLARWYRWLEYAAMGRALERRRFEFLPGMAQARRVLILGEGDGRFLTRVIAPDQRRRRKSTWSTIAQRCSPCAERRASGGSGRTRTFPPDGCASVTLMPASGSPPSIEPGMTSWSPTSFLDCFSDADLEPLISTLRRGVCGNGKLPAGSSRNSGSQRAGISCVAGAALWIGSALPPLRLDDRVYAVRRLPDYHASDPGGKHGFRLAPPPSSRKRACSSPNGGSARSLLRLTPRRGAPLHSRTPKS